MDCNNCDNWKPKPAPGPRPFEPGDTVQHNGTHNKAEVNVVQLWDDGVWMFTVKGGDAWCSERKWTKVPKPAPVADVEAQLREAGASQVLPIANCVKSGPRAYINEKDGSIFLCIDGLTLPRAVAALKVIRGETVYNKEWQEKEIIRLRKGIDFWQLQHLDMDKRRIALETQLAAANAEVERLRALHGCASCPVELREEAKDTEIKRLKGEIALVAVKGLCGCGNCREYLRKVYTRITP
jgi:hypothetical protein